MNKITLKTSAEVYKKKTNASVVNESITKTDDGYMVKTFVEVPQSLIRAMVSKAKNETGKDPKELLGDTDIAELIVQYLHKTFLNVDSIPSSAVLFSSGDKSAQPSAQPGAQVQPVQPAAQSVQATPVPVQPVNNGEEELPLGQVQEGLDPIQEFEYTISGSFTTEQELTPEDIDILQGQLMLQVEEPQQPGDDGFMEGTEWSSTNVDIYIQSK